MYTAHDGKNFGNNEMGKHYDKSRAPMAEKAPTMDGEEEQPIEQSVQGHGPVQEIEMHSKHKDGHVHKSRHHDSKSAHDHVSKAMGEEESPEMQDQGEEMSSSIPGMRG